MQNCLSNMSMENDFPNSLLSCCRRWCVLHWDGCVDIVVYAMTNGWHHMLLMWSAWNQSLQSFGWIWNTIHIGRFQWRMQKIGFHIQWLGYLPLIASNPVFFNIVDEIIIEFKWTARFRAMNFKRSVELQKRLGLSKRFSRLHTVLKTVRTPGMNNLIF